MRIVDQLVRLAGIWSVENDRSVSRLATIVADDGKFFTRIEAGGRLTTETFEKFLTFFRDGANWPAGRIPAEAADLLDNFENIAVEAAASTGPAAPLSRDVAERAA